MDECHHNVVDYLLEGKPSQKVALLQLKGDCTYGDLRRETRKVSDYCLGLGLSTGDRVVLVGENSMFWVSIYLGIMHAGLVCVPLPATISADDLGYILESTQARLAFLQANFAMKHASRLSNMHIVTDVKLKQVPNTLSQASFDELEPESIHSTFFGVTRHDLATIMYTSGSTGRPRGVMVSHRNIIANTESIVQFLHLSDTDRVMTVLPFHYCFGTSLLHTHLRAGASLTLDSRFMYPEVILQRMIETGCTGFAGVPSHFQILLRNSGLLKKSFPKLRYVQQAGGHLAPAYIRELQRALPDIQIFIMYGQTEATARLSYLPPDLLSKKLGSVGKGIPGVELRVLDDAGEDVAPGMIGEVVAEGESVTAGYWQEPGVTANTYRNGRLHTGDLATVDNDGFIYIVDRAQDFLKCGGKRIGCRQIESQLQDFECLLEAAVIGVPDEVLGEAVKAFLVTRMPDCPMFDDCFRGFCKERLLPQVRPKEFVRLRSLPKNSAGKVDKQNLKSSFGSSVT